ncbi:GPW/gp25 family protein [Haliscomenobacter sp.]|uniref:GPW/gp25 family protein n=1 Tax=Haliscomenobacter sp. TaxID=2717303 RepID=UPI003BAB3A56
MGDFLGRGWAFPPSFDAEIGGIQLVEAQEDIQQSIGILLSTALGERVMRPDFGCNLKVFQFEPMNSGFLAYMRDLVYKALVLHEPRIRVDNIQISSDEQLEGKLLIIIDYFIRNTNSRNNFVYDFYLERNA